MKHLLSKDPLKIEKDVNGYMCTNCAGMCISGCANTCSTACSNFCGKYVIL